MSLGLGRLSGEAKVEVHAPSLQRGYTGVMMMLSVTHNRQQETPSAKARWFQSLSLEERMEYLCAITDLILENNPSIVTTRRHAQPTSGRVRVLAGPSG